MGILKKIFILVLFLIPIGEIVRINLNNSIVVKPIDIGVLLMVVLWLIIKLKKRESLKQKNILIPIFLFTASGLFSLLINYYYLSYNQFLTAFLYLFRWAVYASIFFVVNDFDTKFKKQIPNLLIAIGALIVALGYIQYFFYFSLKSLTYLGWDEHMYRMFSVFLDPNFAGAFFVLFFLFAVNIFLKKKSILIGVLCILTLGAVFLTFSRSAIIMLLASSSLLFILLNKKIWIILLLGVISSVLLISSKYFNIENINLFRIVSTEARIETAENAIKIIQNKPIFGVGFNAYRYAQLQYGFRDKDVKTVSHADAGVDNSLLFVLATTGIIGFTSFIFMWFRIFKNSGIVASVSIIGIFIDSLFINSLFYTYIMFWLWTVIGINSSANSELRENS